MPILAREIDLSPPNLFELFDERCREDAQWWVLYTLSRQEKQLLRRLRALDIAFYCPMIARRLRSPAGRVRTSYVPLFNNYVFLWGSDQQRRTALTTRCVSHVVSAAHDPALPRDLRQIQRLIATGAALAPETRLESGTPVRVKSGAFRDFEGTVIRREGQARLLVAVNFLQQGASVLLDDCQLERLA
jgi:transcription antitermination factor NusG